MERRDLLKAGAVLPMSNLLGSLSRRPVAPATPTTPTATSSSGQVGKIAETLIATSDANGNITFNVGIVPGGNVWIGGFNCPSAPYTAQFTLSSAGTELDSWQASNNPGPFRADSGDTLVITGTGMVPNTSYQMFFNGYQTTSGVAPQLVPESHTDVVIATNQGGLKIVAAATPTGIGAQVEVVLSAPPSGFAYRLHSVSVQTYGFGAANTVAIIANLQDSVGGYNFFTTYSPAGAYLAQTFLMNGQLIAGAITAEVLPAGSSGGTISIIYLFTVTYDLIQI